MAGRTDARSWAAWADPGHRHADNTAPAGPLAAAADQYPFTWSSGEPESRPPSAPTLASFGMALTETKILSYTMLVDALCTVQAL